MKPVVRITVTIEVVNKKSKKKNEAVSLTIKPGPVTEQGEQTNVVTD